MIKNILRIWLGLLLIALASAVLLFTDHPRPKNAGSGSEPGANAPRRVQSVAIFQHVSQQVLEEGAKGAIAALAAAGYRNGDAIKLRRFNSEGDSATSNTIARELVGGDYDLIITLSTPSLQALAAANRDVKRPHVFGLVSDPPAAGVGVARDNPMKHPPYMVGLGTMQPVGDAFRMARRIAPKLARVGVAWNPSEANSEACTKVARTICKELGIELLEANVDNSAGVREAVSSVIGRGAEAIWVGGDTTVLVALDAVVGPARTAGIPVFTNISGSASRGALFDLGADYYRVGGMTGEIAAQVLGGKPPAEMPIQYEVPPEFWINRVTAGELKGTWTVPPDIEAKADVLVETSGPVRRRPRAETTPPPAPAKLSRTWKIGLAAYTDSSIVDESVNGFKQGLKDAGLVQGRDIRLDYRNAQGDIGTLNAIVDELNSNPSDLVVAFSTPCLQAALRKIDRKPLIFGLVLDPFVAGAGTSDTEHRPNVTGCYLTFPYKEMAVAVREILPRAKRIGTLFTPGELNSVVARKRFEEALKATGFELITQPINAPTDVSDAALTVCQAGIDVFCQISDNLSNSCFPGITQACQATKTPLFCFATGQVTKGAMVAVGSDYSENGRDTGLLVAEIIRGKSVATTPFNGKTRIRRSVNLDSARAFGVTVPADWIRKADEVLPARPGSPKPNGTK